EGLAALRPAIPPVLDQLSPTHLIGGSKSMSSIDIPRGGRTFHGLQGLGSNVGKALGGGHSVGGGPPAGSAPGTGGANDGGMVGGQDHSPKDEAADDRDVMGGPGMGPVVDNM